MTANVDQRLSDIQKEYLEFLDDEGDQGKYTQMAKQLITTKNKRLIVNINDLRHKNPIRTKGLLNNAFEEQFALEKALREFVMTIEPDCANNISEFFVGFEGSFGHRHVTPRTLFSGHLGNLVCIEGIVTKCSLVYTKLVTSVHYCPATKKYIEKKYSDFTSLTPYPSGSVYPTKDEDGNALETQFGLSQYIDHQKIYIQEMPEKIPVGQISESIEIICENDLADSCKPGDRIQVIGSYRCLPSKETYYTNTIFRTIIIANNIKQLSEEVAPTISRDDIAKCKSLAKSNKSIFDLLAKSLAPSIYGHDYVKKAILCLLLGGVEKLLATGTRLRGDINILLIGDPSVAKSQLLRFVLSTAPRAVSTTGRGSSGVGLTAAVTTDSETGEKYLEAGAMVIADRGVVCIDEFDKMSDIDRTAIHEVMEQGRITIAKAGIHASLNARCSLLAAANPVYGKYDQYRTPMENIGLQDSLLSRFDLIFIMLDSVSEDQDLIISDHVISVHQYRDPKEKDGDVLKLGLSSNMWSTQNIDLVEATDSSSIFEQYETHGRSIRILKIDFLRKYIHFAKLLKPVLTDESSELISNEYAKLRNEELMNVFLARTQPVTARSVETMIRLATAHAKARLSSTIDKQDAEVAIELVQFAIFKKILQKEKRKRTRNESESSSEDEDFSQFRKRRPNAETTQVTVSQQSSVTNVEATVDNEMETEVNREGEEASITLGSERLSKFKTSLLAVFRKNKSQSLSLSQVYESVNEDNDSPFSQAEIKSALNQMSEDNQLMVADDAVIII